jgi:DNA-binding LacI/PurR family transcriptional regulator
LTTHFNHTPVQDRLKGYKQALAEATILFRPEYYVQGEHGRLPARAMTHQLLDLPDPPTAIFAYSDTQAIGAIEAARERGLIIPDDLSVIGFDNIEASEYLNITTIRQALHESGVRGSELLLQIIAKRPFAPIKIVLPTEVIKRGTTTTFKEVVPNIRTI